MKALEIAASILKGIASASVTFQSIDGTAPVTVSNGATTYGDVIAAIMKSDSNGYWKNSMIDSIPKNATASEYAAALAIIEDDSMNSYWKNSMLEKVFEGS